MSAGKTRTRIDGRELIMEREFDAPKKLVYRAHTIADQIARWWGPAGWDTHSCEMTVEPGGTWHYCIRSSMDGQEAWGKVTYREVEDNERLVYEDVFTDLYGNEIEGLPKMFIKLYFSEDGNRTALTSRTLFESEEELQRIFDTHAVEGMSESYDRLEQFLNDQQKTRKEGQS